jgi:hypothetical protein
MGNTPKVPLHPARNQETTVAGEGSDGALYGVVHMVTKAGEGKKLARKKPCRTCPWRKDSETGRFPAEAYRISAITAHDTSLNMFSCHESGTGKPAVCAGFLLANSNHNIGVRLDHMSGKLDPRHTGNPDKVELYESYRAMAIANGVDPEDPAIAACRGNDEDGFEVAKRIRQTGYKGPIGIQANVRIKDDE